MSYKERKEKEQEIVADAIEAERSAHCAVPSPGGVTIANGIALSHPAPTRRMTEEISRRIALEQQYEALKEICVVNAAVRAPPGTLHQPNPAWVCLCGLAC